MLSVFELYLYSDIFDIFKYIFEYVDILPLSYPYSYSKQISDTDIHIQKSNAKSDIMRIIHIHLHPGLLQLFKTLLEPNSALIYGLIYVGSKN